LEFGQFGQFGRRHKFDFGRCPSRCDTRPSRIPHRSISYRHKTDQVALWDQQGQLIEEHHLVSAGFHLCLVQGEEEGLYRLFSDSKRKDQVELGFTGFHSCLVQGEQSEFRYQGQLSHLDYLDL